MAEDSVSKDEFGMYVKGVNGDLDDIKTSIATLTDNMNRRFDALDLKFEAERGVGREAHQRIHERIEGVNDSLVAEMAGVGTEFGLVKAGIAEEMKDIRGGHVSKAMAGFIVFLSSLSLALIAVVLTLALK